MKQSAGLVLVALGMFACGARDTTWLEAVEADVAEADPARMEPRDKALLAPSLLEMLELNEANGLNRGLVHRLPVGDGTIVDFYEHGGGYAGISRTGVAEADFEPLDIPAHLPPTEVFHLIAPEREVPQALIALEQRLLAQKSQAPEHAAEPEDPAVVEARREALRASAEEHLDSVPKSHGGTTCNVTWFMDSFCDRPNTDWQDCQPNLTVGRSWADNNLAYNRSTTCMDRGSWMFMNVDITQGEGNGTEALVTAGHWRQYSILCGTSFWDGCDEFALRVDTVSVESPDRYHSHILFNFD